MLALGPHSRPFSIETVDGRTREAKVLKAAEREFLAQLGHAPTPVERALVEEALHARRWMQRLDGRYLAAGSMTEADAATYLRWSAAYREALRKLGLDTEAPRQRSLADTVAEHHP